MEEQTKDPVGTQTTASGEPEKNQQTETVAYESYKKLLAEKKARDERLAQQEQKLKDFERRELETKGELDKLNASLREENANLKSTIQKRDKAYIMSKVHGAIKDKAIQFGCRQDRINPLLKMLGNEQIESLEVDENFNVSERDVDYLIGEVKKDFSEWFVGKRANVADGNPVDKPVVAKAKPVEKMTKEELEAAILAAAQ